MSSSTQTGSSAAARQRSARATQLAASTPAAASLLTFYAALAEQQVQLYDAYGSRSVTSADGRTLGEAVDRDAVVVALGGLLTWVGSAGPPRLAEAASALASCTSSDWRQRLDTFIDGLPDSVDAGCEGFLVEAALQPFAEAAAAGESGDAGLPTEPIGASGCPFCRDRPSVAVLRDAGHGARRSFVCGLCLTEGPAPRLGCVACGETAFERLPVFRDEALAAARVDACDTCRVYVKTIDLTRDGRAVAVVDDLATVAMDLWAREQGYRRLRPHLLRV